MNEIVRVFDDHLVRIHERDGAPWFVAKDVCGVLGLTNASKALQALDDDEKSGVTISDPHGRKQESNIISESGLYKLIMRSRKPAAKAFVKWITAEVLPSIRKHGAYVASGATEAGVVEAVIAGINRGLAEQVRENVELKVNLAYHQSFTPRGAVGEISKANGCPRVQWRSGSWVSRFGRPYSQLLDNVNAVRCIGGHVETPMLPGLED